MYLVGAELGKPIADLSLPMNGLGLHLKGEWFLGKQPRVVGEYVNPMEVFLL